MRIDGACHCGEIRYEADVDPEKVALCNCTDCQTLSGSAFRANVFVDVADLRFLAGEAVEYVKTGESGKKRAQAFCRFCRSCGTGLYATSAGEGPRVYGLRVGTIRQREQLVPKRQAWLRSRLQWLSELDNVPGTEKQ